MEAISKELDEKIKVFDTNLHSFQVNPELAESFKCLSQQMNEGTKNIGLALQSVFEPCRNLIDSLTPLFTNISIPFEKLAKLDNKPFVECGLWLTPSMTPGIVRIAVEKYEQGKKRVIPNIVEGFYRRNNHEMLKHAVASWSDIEFYSPRMHIFKDALDAHISGKWTLTIPTLLPHIEGIAGEILRSNGLHIKKEIAIFDGGAKTVPSSVFRNFPELEETSIKYIVISSFLDYLERTLYISSSFENSKIRILAKLNRHAILHGYQINYATRLNSLRCFLALDSLSWLKEKHI